MARKLSLVLPALFVLVFAFCLVVQMHSPAEAEPLCCYVVNVCDGIVYQGCCPRIDKVCRCDVVVDYCPPGPPLECDID
ncbi:MAG: hypothetical protein AB1483_06340 [Candidatus Zixiibacteriota bacterium]